MHFLLLLPKPHVPQVDNTKPVAQKPSLIVKLQLSSTKNTLSPHFPLLLAYRIISCFDKILGSFNLNSPLNNFFHEALPAIKTTHIQAQTQLKDIQAQTPNHTHIYIEQKN